MQGGSSSSAHLTATLILAPPCRSLPISLSAGAFIAQAGGGPPAQCLAILGWMTVVVGVLLPLCVSARQELRGRRQLMHAYAAQLAAEQLRPAQEQHARQLALLQLFSMRNLYLASCLVSGWCWERAGEGQRGNELAVRAGPLHVLQAELSPGLYAMSGLQAVLNAVCLACCAVLAGVGSGLRPEPLTATQVLRTAHDCLETDISCVKPHYILPPSFSWTLLTIQWPAGRLPPTVLAPTCYNSLAMDVIMLTKLLPCLLTCIPLSPALLSLHLSARESCNACFLRLLNGWAASPEPKCRHVALVRRQCDPWLRAAG